METNNVVRFAECRQERFGPVWVRLDPKSGTFAWRAPEVSSLSNWSKTEFKKPAEAFTSAFFTYQKKVLEEEIEYG